MGGIERKIFNKGLQDIYGIGGDAVDIPIVSSVQQVDFSLTANVDLTDSVTINSVDTTRTILIYSGVKNDTSTVGGNVLMSYELINPTTVTATRIGNSGNNLSTIYVIEFLPGIIDSLQTGSITITATNLTNTDTITSVDTTRSIVVFHGIDTSASTEESSDCALDLTNSTTVTAERLATTSFCNVNYAVVEFNANAIEEVNAFNISISGVPNDILTEVSNATRGPELPNTLRFYNGKLHEISPGTDIVPAGFNGNLSIYHTGNTTPFGNHKYTEVVFKNGIKRSFKRFSNINVATLNTSLIDTFDLSKTAIFYHDYIRNNADYVRCRLSTSTQVTENKRTTVTNNGYFEVVEFV